MNAKRSILGEITSILPWDYFLNNEGVDGRNTLWLEVAPIIYNTRAGLADEHCNCLG